MYNLFIQRNAHMPWKPSIAKKGTLAAMLCHEISGSLIDLTC
jgi:hypothetical protein